jgi:hypothetical protein
VGRQINLVATRGDMGLLFEQVRLRGGQVAELWDYSPDPVVVTHPSGLEGVILPPQELLLLDRSFHPRRGTWITRELSSQAVFVRAGHTLEGVPRIRPPGRLTRSAVLGYDLEDEPIRPAPAFESWCDSLYDWVRRWTLLGGAHHGPQAASTYVPEVEVTWVLARSGELSYGETDSVLALWRRDLDLPESDLRIRVADHGGYVSASIHVKTVVRSAS